MKVFYLSRNNFGCVIYANNEITMKDRIYICPSCGHVMDRDHQAAVNLKEEALRIISENIAQIKRMAA